MSDRREMWSRRELMRGLTVVGTTGLIGVRATPAAVEPPPETTTIRIGSSRSLCFPPQYVAEALLRAEGFANVQ